jgi:DNA repair photolyase
MVQVTLVDRKSKALTPSHLRCLAHLPTINMTAGCVHGCAYCYIRGYSQYPGDDAVVVYRNTAEQVERELGSKRKRPVAVYFSPSSDAFMPVEEVLDQSYRTMRLLLDRGIGVQFVTKGAIPDCFFDLFARRPELVAGQIGLTTLNDQLNAVIEPHAVPAQCRLGDLRRLIPIGVTASLRADPLIPGVTDDDAGLDALFAQASACGCAMCPPVICSCDRRSSVHCDGPSKILSCCSASSPRLQVPRRRRFEAATPPARCCRPTSAAPAWNGCAPSPNGMTCNCTSVAARTPI